MSNRLITPPPSAGAAVIATAGAVLAGVTLRGAHPNAVEKSQPAKTVT